MLPAITQAVEGLRGDGHDPIRAFDAWVLATIEELPPLGAGLPAGHP